MHNGALILEGGAMRGVFTAGVLDYLMEREFEISYVVSVSVGTCNALDYISRQPKRTLNCMALKDDRYRYIHKNLFELMKKREAFDLDMIYNQFPNKYFPFDYDTYFASPIESELVLTNCLTGEAEYLDERQDRKRLMQLSAASSSMPYVSHAVEVDGVPYVDGGVSDSVPLIHTMKKGYRKNVVILTRQKGYRKKEGKRLHFLTKLIYRKYPNLVETLNNRAKVYNRTMDLIDKWEDEGKIFVIRPQGETVSRTEEDYEKLTAFYQEGYDLMKERYEELQRYFEK